MMKASLVAIAICVIGVAEESALADDINFGCVDRAGDGHPQSIYRCNDTTDSWLFYNEGCTMTSDYNVSGTSGSDFIRVVRFNDTQISCAGTTLLWDDVYHDGFLLTVSGYNGDDYMISDDEWTRMYGQGGDDTLWQYNSGIFDGGDGNDRLEAATSSDHDDLIGGDGEDCLHDFNGWFDTFSCDYCGGNLCGYDDYYVDNLQEEPFLGGGCEEAWSSCAGYCGWCP